MKRAFLVLTMLAGAFSAGTARDAAAAAPAPATYGSWRSPITAEMLVHGTVRFGDMCLDGQTLYWVESRPEEAGRYVIVRRTPDGTITDMLPSPYSARTLVHEYGGGAMLASQEIVYFSNYADQRIWRIRPGEHPEAVTAAGKLRFADFVHDLSRNRLISVCEDHTPGDHQPVNRLVSIDLDGGAIRTLVEGHDFYSNPRLSPDGRQLAWLSWDHPNMPWDGTELFVAQFMPDGSLDKPRKVAGGQDESIFQPAWAPDETLYFVSDRSNWWNLYREHDGQVTAMAPMEAEFGVPQWVFGMTTYGFDKDGDVLARYTRGGQWYLVRIKPGSGHQRPIEFPYSTVANLLVGDTRAYAILGSPSAAEMLAEIDLATGHLDAIRQSSPLTPDPDYTSIPTAIEFSTDDNKTAHGFYYPPANRDYSGMPGEAPPLLVMIHGGPTGATAAQFRLSTQYWTSRGFAVCDVNYGGSTGYGREYRNRLRRSWGVVDVADAANAALYLARQGKADRQKLMIRGGSAGGYTTLACLAFRDDVFYCGASYYGISDLALLARDTHKFESHYLDRLVGRYPEEKDRYDARSAVDHLDQFKRPVILLQGLEDKVVPPEQAELILESLKKRGVPVAYVPFSGEQHGFRKAESIVRAQEAELYFYSRVLGFKLPDAIEPIEIANLPAN
jgi:dipeptidyl aminopeptidase/acylaminoacyl peptidase